MITKELISGLPNFSAIIGEHWLRQNRDWAEDFISDLLPWYEQLENDISILRERLNIQKLASCYRDSLRNQSQIQKTIFEVHGAALFASVATEIDLHVLRGDGSGRDFDIGVKVGGYQVNAESKTREDQFPFNLPAEVNSGGFRATMDPHDAQDFGIESMRVDGYPYKETPESTVIRQALLGGLGQLPTTGNNFIIFGQIRGARRNLERALYGTEFVQRQVYLKTKEVTFSLKMAPTGAFDQGPAGEPFRGLNGVLWVRLMPRSLEDNSLGRAYKLYLNPNSSHLSDDLVQALNSAMEQWTTIKEERVEEASE